ncbi:MAG TPA: flagellar brake protein [Limnochordia bacterium]|nr:flagellar brake protein [Limnochordia bacterium]
MQLLPNQSVELHLEGDASIEIYRTRVEDAYDSLLIVGAPIKQGVIVPLRLGTRLDVQFKLKNSIQEGRFRNQAIIEKRFLANNLPLLQLRLLGSWEKNQDRGFVRVPVSIDTVFMFYEENGAESTPLSGLMLDLSGGGFLLRTSHSFDLDDEVRISFNLKDETIVADATVARLVPTDTGIDYGMAFLDLAEQARQTIIKFVFQRQITLAELVGKNPK